MAILSRFLWLVDIALHVADWVSECMAGVDKDRY